MAIGVRKLMTVRSRLNAVKRKLNRMQRIKKEREVLARALLSLVSKTMPIASRWI